MNLDPFKALLRERCGLEFNGIAEKPLRDSIEARRAALGRMSCEAYRAKVATDEQEFDQLVSLVTINETYFFREPDQIRFFVDTLVPTLLTKVAPQPPLRILSAGCSTGEEPYSLAIALWEKYGPAAAQRFVIVAGDIDRQALQKASLGIYREFSFRSLPSDLRAKYFEPTGEKGIWQIKDSVRALVEIQHLNLFSTPLPNDRPFDAIFFRNVSIYFGVEKRRQIQELFHRLLHPHGVLMIGTAETLANDLGVFGLVEQSGLFFFAKQVPPDTPTRSSRVPSGRPTPTPTPAVPPPLPTLTPRKPTNPPSIDELVVLLREKRLGEAGPHLEVLTGTEPPDTELLLLQSFYFYQKHDLGRSEAVARRVLDQQTWSVDACVLLGLIAKGRGDHAGAIPWFKQAVYERNECWPAHYYLGELYRRPNPEKAPRFFRTVLHLLSSGAPASTGLQVVPLDLPAAEVRLLCELHLDKLSAVGR